MDMEACYRCWPYFDKYCVHCAELNNVPLEIREFTVKDIASSMALEPLCDLISGGIDSKDIEDKELAQLWEELNVSYIKVLNYISNNIED